MINPQFEIDRLRHSLIFNGYDQREADVIVENAHSDMNNMISEIVGEAISEAIRIASELGVNDFAKQLRAVKMGGTYTIVTDSGKVDYSEPARPMLGNLLKNAKVAKDGSLYKVIPIKVKPRLTNIFDVQQGIDESRKAIMESVKTDNERSVSVVKHAGAFSGLAQAKEFINRRNELKKQKLEDKTEEVKFRTASSKQDAGKMWVQPPKDKNLSTILVDINRKLEDDIQGAVSELVKAYEEQFL